MVLTSGVKHLEAKILQVNGKLAEAAKAYEVACNMSDTHQNGFLNLADMMRRTGNKKQAREILVVAFKFPQDASIPAKLGLAMFDERHVDQVQKLLEYALKTDENNIDVLHQAAGTFYRVIGQPDLATTHFKQTLKVTGKPQERKVHQAHQRL